MQTKQDQAQKQNELNFPHGLSHYPEMHGNFNGIRLQKITSRKITTTDRGTTLYSFHTPERLPELEAILRLDVPALLILSNETVEGTIVHYSANVQAGYEVTMELTELPKSI
jgi:hypothetical protein